MIRNNGKGLGREVKSVLDYQDVKYCQNSGIKCSLLLWLLEWKVNCRKSQSFHLVRLFLNYERTKYLNCNYGTLPTQTIAVAEHHLNVSWYMKQGISYMLFYMFVCSISAVCDIAQKVDIEQRCLPLFLCSTIGLVCSRQSALKMY